MLPIGRRQALLQWAAEQGARIIEDDYDGEFRYGQRPIDALQAIAPAGRVRHVGTFSKALSPQLRLGYLVLPPALASLIDSGAYERHVRRARRGNERRRAALLAAIARALPSDARGVGAGRVPLVAAVCPVAYFGAAASSEEWPR